MRYKKTEYFKAIQWTGNNLDDVAKFLKDGRVFIQADGLTLCVDYHTNVYTCYLNAYIVVGDKDKLQIVPETTFKKQYIAVNDKPGNIFKDDYQLEDMEQFVDDLSNTNLPGQYMFYSRFKAYQEELDEKTQIINKYFSNATRGIHDVYIVNEQLAVVVEMYKDSKFYYGIDRNNEKVNLVAFRTFNEALIYAMAISNGNEDINSVKYVNSILNAK